MSTAEELEEQVVDAPRLLEDDALDEDALFGPEAPEEDDVLDEDALFGPEVPEEAPAAVPAIEAPPDAEDGLSAGEQLSDMDERDIFGEMSEEEQLEKIEDVILRRRPAPDQNRPFMSLRLPNVLSVEKTAFNPRSIPSSLMDGYREITNMQGNKVARLVTPENCLRWRFKKDENGHNTTDKDGRPQYESNARVVEWEDGTRTMHVGNEFFNLSEIPDRILLFEENSSDVHVCHGLVQTRLIATPKSLSSATHESLKKSQHQKFEPNRRSMLISPQEQMESKQLLELQMDQKKAQMKRAKRALEPAQGAEITAAFLEDDQPTGSGPSVRDIKNEVKRMRTA